jgi:hypothetical protein
LTLAGGSAIVGAPPFSLSKRTTPQGVDVVVEAGRYEEQETLAKGNV